MIKHLSFYCLFIIIFLINCASNLPIRSAKTLPQNVSYHSINIFKSNIKSVIKTNDTANVDQSFDKFSSLPGFSYSYRRGLLNWLEVEVGGGYGFLWGLGFNGRVKIPLSISSAGTGVPVLPQKSRWGLSASIGGFVSYDSDGTQDNSWRKSFVPGLHGSVDIINKRDFILLFNTGIEYNFTSIKTTITIDFDSDNESYNNHYFETQMLQVPVELSVFFKRFNISIGVRPLFHLTNFSFSSSTDESNYFSEIDFIENYFILFSFGYSHNFNKVRSNYRKSF